MIRVRLEVEVDCPYAERLEETTRDLGRLLDPLDTNEDYRLTLVRFSLVREEP